MRDRFSDFEREFAKLIDSNNIHYCLSRIDAEIYHHYQRTVTITLGYERAKADLAAAFGPKNWEILQHAIWNPYLTLLAICTNPRPSRPVRYRDFSDSDLAHMAFMCVNERNVLDIFELLPPNAQDIFDVTIGHPMEAIGDEKVDIVEASKVYRAAKRARIDAKT